MSTNHREHAARDSELRPMYGGSIDALGTLLARDVGALLLALGVIDLLARRAPSSPLLRAVLVANLVCRAVKFALDLHAVRTQTGGTAGWGPVAQHAIIGLGFAYYLIHLTRPGAQKAEV